jgi:hypothetical protein
VVKNENGEKTHSLWRLDLAARWLRPHSSSCRSERFAKRTRSLSRAGTKARRDEMGQDPIDVVCAGMYRACSTWQYEVVAHLLEHFRDGKRLGYLTCEQYAALLRADALVQPPAPHGSRCWRVVKSHEGDRSFARALAAGRARAVYAHRDVRDVVFSLMHKRAMTFDQLLRQGMIHQILANDRFWMAQPDILVQRYDDLLADPIRGVKELARHLDIALAESEAARIAELYSRESNRARSQALERRLKESGVNLESAASVQICDPTTLLHWNHMRQSGAGSWRTSATPSDRAILHRLCGRWLKARGYPPDPTPTHKVSLSPRALGALARQEASLMVGRLTFLMRTASQRLPATARTVKHILGMPEQTNAGATAWSDPVPSHPVASRPGAGSIASVSEFSPSESVTVK